MDPEAEPDSIPNYCGEYVKQMAEAIEMSNRIMSEDLLREAGFMLPQGKDALNLINKLVAANESEDFPKEAAEKLTKKLNDINKKSDTE